MGAIYHLREGAAALYGGEDSSRASEISASAKYDYIAGEDKFGRRTDKLVHAISGNMPAWAQDNPGLYWQSADENERANGRLYKEFEVDLPAELTPAQQQRLVEHYLQQLTGVPKAKGKGRGKDCLPFSAGVHEGTGTPVVHIMVSERVNDGIARTPELWFRRAATGINKTAAAGGAKKVHLKDQWLVNARKLWVDLIAEPPSASSRSARSIKPEEVAAPSAQTEQQPSEQSPAHDDEPELSAAHTEYEQLHQERQREAQAVDQPTPVQEPSERPAAPTVAPRALPAKPQRKLKTVAMVAGALTILAGAAAIGWPRSKTPPAAAPVAAPAVPVVPRAATPAPVPAPAPAQPSTPALPLPLSGQGVVYAPWAPEAAVAPFVVQAPPVGTHSPDRHYFVTANDWNTNSPVLSIFVRAGEVGRTVLPVGRYRLTISEGSSWYGPVKLFGPQGASADDPRPVDLPITGGDGAIRLPGRIAAGPANH